MTHPLSNIEHAIESRRLHNIQGLLFKTLRVIFRSGSRNKLLKLASVLKSDGAEVRLSFCLPGWKLTSSFELIEKY